MTTLLPGKVGASDLDFVLERHGKMLVCEFKSSGEPLPMGQRLLLRCLVNLGADVWCCWEYPDGTAEVGSLDRTGQVPFVQRVARSEIAKRVRAWWDAS